MIFKELHVALPFLYVFIYTPQLQDSLDKFSESKKNIFKSVEIEVVLLIMKAKIKNKLKINSLKALKAVRMILSTSNSSKNIS